MVEIVCEKIGDSWLGQDVATQQKQLGTFIHQHQDIQTTLLHISQCPRTGQEGLQEEARG